MLASFLFLVWTIQAATAVQSRLAFAEGQGTIAAVEPVAQPTILVRDIARHLGAETFRFKTGAYVPVVQGGGKFVGIAPDVRLPLETASGTPFAVWHDAWPHLPPIRAFDARGPPPLAA